jgi:CzcA family heavy metal efflux pump
MTAASWAASHKRSILFFVSFLTLAGLATSFISPVSLFPHVVFPRIVVAIDAGDQPADKMSIAVTRPIEQAIRAVPGVVNLRSTSSRGSAEVSVNFEWGQDMVSALLQVDAALNQSLATLPAGVKFSVRRMDPTVFPIAAYSLTSDSLSLVQLKDIADLQLVPLLSSVSGIAKIGVLGGQESEYHIDVNPDKLAAYQLNFNDIAQAVSTNNTLQAIGRLEDHYKLYLLMSDSRLKGDQAINNIVVKSQTTGNIYLKDVAKVSLATAPQWIKVNADGHEAVLVQVYQQPQGNSVQITKDINQKLADFSATNASSLKIANWYDQSQLVTESATSVRDAIIIGVLLAGLVLLIFLRSIKITLIAMIIVPAVLASTVLLLWLFGMSFNIMTLGGMAAAVGLIVDDAIVMIEHIIRRLRDAKPGTDKLENIQKAAVEFTKPLVGSSSATIVIFIPLAFLSGVTGSFFKALSLTMASSLLISFLFTWLIVPLLAEYFLTDKDVDKEDIGPIFARIQQAYRQLMSRLIKRPWLISLGLVPLLFCGFLSYQNVGTGFMPAMDEGGFVLDYVSAPGTSLTESNRLLLQVEDILQKNPAVETYSRRTGLALSGGLVEANEGDFFVRLTPFPRPPIDQIMSEIRHQIDDQVPGLEIEMALLMEDVIGDLTAVPQPIEIKLYGNKPEELMALAPKVADAISNISGVVDVKDGIVLAGNAVNVIVNRDKAILQGLTPAEVTSQLDSWFNGQVVTTIQQGIKLVDVRVWVPEGDRTNILSLEQFWLTAPDGHRLQLKQIANVVIESGQPQIVRDNLKNMVGVTGRIDGRDMGSTVAEIKLLLNNSPLLPKDVYFELGGLYQQQQIAFKGLIAVFVAAIALIFILLLYMYETFSAAVAIIITPLLSISAVFIGLWVTNTELNITAMMGMTMIAGIVTEISIFYFSEYKELIANGVGSDQAIIQAGSNRLRPISMTTLATILALMPLALAIGQGSAMQQPLAIAIISGLLVQIPLAIIIMPITYRALSSKSYKLSKSPKKI